MSSTSLLPLDTLADTIKAHIAAGDKAIGKAEEHYKSAGLHLMEARERVKREGKTFSAFLIGHRIGSSHAYDLIAIANGTKTLAGVRATAADRVARHADKNRRAREASVSNGQPDQSSPLVEGDSAVAAPEVVIDNLLHSIGGMNESARVFNKVLKASAFDRQAVTKINTAIDRMIKKWGSIQSVLGVTTPALSGADVEKLKEQLDAGLRAIEAYSDESADKERLQAEVDRLTEENERLRAEIDRLTDANLADESRDEVANSLHLVDDEREIAEKLVEMDGKKLAKLTKILNDYLKHAPQTPEEVSMVIGWSGIEGEDGRRLSTKAALERLRNPGPPQDYSWRVEAETADGTRWSNGVRLWTEEEAKTYAESYTRFDLDGCIAADIVRCDGEPPTNNIFKKRGRPTLTFDHGTCGSLRWKPLPNSHAAQAA